VCSNLVKNGLNILFAKFSFGMNEKGHKTLAVRGSNQKVWKTKCRECLVCEWRIYGSWRKQRIGELWWFLEAKGRRCVKEEQ